jgi:hypothetical protein
MRKIYEADKDAYITNKVIRGNRVTGSNVGYAGTLDLFKLYGVTSSGTYPNLEPNKELTRVLMHFDLASLKSLVEQKKIDIDDDSFFCKLVLKDVYGGQPTPNNFTVSVFPLSASFDEGIGKDVSYYSDRDVCNWMSSSLTSAWFMSGCAAACFATGSGDYITSSLSIPNTEVTQIFKTGVEDLEVDVTKIVSATMTNELPDSGFRISFKNSLEDDSFTYFVKRLASRHAYDDTKRPKLIMGFDDSIQDDTQSLTFDKPSQINLYNFSGGDLANIVSGSLLTPIIGSNSLYLKLMTDVVSGTYNLIFTASQYSLGKNEKCFVTGTYAADVTVLSSDAVIKQKLLSSSSVKFTPVWMSLDQTVAYVTGSTLTFYPTNKTSSRMTKNYVVTVSNAKESYRTDEEPIVRVNIFDNTSPLIKVTRLPVTLSGVVLRDVYYQVRNVVTDEIVVPFDDLKKSTRVSSDSEGMFFKLDVDSLAVGKTYTIDILVHHDGTKTRYQNVSAPFKITAADS